MSERLNRCPTCGTEGQISGRSFCEVCGDFVDWDEVARSARAPGAGAATDGTRGTAPPPPPPSGAAPPPAPEQPSTPQTQPPLPPAPRPQDTQEQQRRARELLVPLSEPQVSPVMPGRPVQPRPEVRPPMAVQESGIACWNCGVGNRPDRRFCRNCGVDLTAVPAPPSPSRPSWLQRLLAWLRRNWILVAAVPAVALLAVPAVLLGPGLLAARAEAVLPPAEVAASQADDEHPAASAFDGVQDSWWGPGRTGDSAGHFLQAGFSQPVDLSAVTIIPGVSGRPEDRNRESRPRLIDIAISDVGGRTTVFNVELEDGVIQRIVTPVDEATRVTLTLRSAYIAGRDRQVAIAEVQLLGRQSRD